MFLQALNNWIQARQSNQRRMALQMSLQRAYRNHIIGRFSYGSPKIHFANSGSKLQVGQFCSIADNVKIFLGGEHRTDWVTTYPFPQMLPAASHISGHPATKGDVIIGNDVWIGHGAIILSGVRIGDGAVIGAQAVLSRDVPAYAIIGGNPARVLRPRFEPMQINALLAIAWWDWSMDRIEAELPYLLSGDIDAFIKRQSPEIQSA